MGNIIMPVFWADLRSWLPGTYRCRTALSPAFTLQVSGRRRGGRCKAVLYSVSPKGCLRRIWSCRFIGAKGFDSDRLGAVSLFIDAAARDPRLSGRHAIDDAVKRAEYILAEGA